MQANACKTQAFLVSVTDATLTGSSHAWPKSLSYLHLWVKDVIPPALARAMATELLATCIRCMFQSDRALGLRAVPLPLALPAKPVSIANVQA